MPLAVRHMLQAHRDSRTQVVRAIEVNVTRAVHELRLSYVLRGDVDAIAWPAPAAPARTDELWRHTCFEAFVRLDGAETYYEFNFAPSRQWAAYRFDGYRAGMAPAFEFADPRIEIVQGGDSFGLEAAIAMPNRPLNLALAAVIEDKAGCLSYWALTHAPGKADFHHANGFALTLEPA
jgi:hypothetical protein